jgi:two-component system, OmpR family, alkaline phosphatase synthesis response regulator PhoP
MSEKKALIVDDEIHILQVIAIKLRNNGFEVITANDGQKALEVALEQKPDVIVTDYQMPIMDGLGMIENLRKQEETSHIPVIMLTARNFAIEEQTIEQFKISACLSKPFSPRELLGKIEEVIAQTATA